MGILLALVAAAAYGSADFLGGMAARKAALLAVALGAQAVGLIVVLIALVLHPEVFSIASLEWGALAGLAGAAGIALLYHALSIGRMGVVSPVTALLAASVPVIFGIVTGERPSLLADGGLLLAAAAIVAISASFESDGRREFDTAGLREALLSGIAFGAFFTLLGLTRDGAPLLALLGSRLASVSLLASIVIATRTPLRLNGATTLVLIGGALDMAANLLYLLAARIDGLAISAVLTSLYPASTVLLAAVILRERLSRIQWVGVLCALVAVAMIAAR
ncbi:MAG: EamA family transporter [Candidatus Baltobacteraceae bacterium]